MNAIKYVIADDHKIFRQGLKLALADDENLHCIGEAADGIELLALMQSTSPDVILLDINMPEINGKDALVKLRTKNKQVKVLVLTMYEEEQFIVDLIEAGANGYLLKNAEPSEIIMAMNTVCDTGFYFNDLVSATLLRQIVQKTHTKQKQPIVVKLTSKEAEVLKLICAELTAAEIAEKINLSQRTVEGIRSSLLEKTKARNTAGLVLFAVKNELVPN